MRSRAMSPTIRILEAHAARAGKGDPGRVVSRAVRFEEHMHVCPEYAWSRDETLGKNRSYAKQIEPRVNKPCLLDSPKRGRAMAWPYRLHLPDQPAAPRA